MRKNSRRPERFSPVTQSADLGKCDHATFLGDLHPSGRGRVFFQREMSARPIVVVRIFLENSSQVCLPERDEMVDTLATDRADEPLCVEILPWRAGRGGSVDLQCVSQGRRRR